MKHGGSSGTIIAERRSPCLDILAGVDEAGHVPVLLAETMRVLDPQPGQVVVDCTVGRGGHSGALSHAVGQGGTVVGFDVDPDDLAFASRRLRDAPARFEPVRDNFVRAPHHLSRLGLQADAIVADLGFSSRQMTDPQRGLSFRADGPLDMRLDPEGPVTARDLVETLTEPELVDLVRRYGEDPLARKIAGKIVQARDREPIVSTTQLAAIVVEAYGSRAYRSRMHPATRTFMALRIAVNDELTALAALLENIADDAAEPREAGWLAPGARVAIISFHSLEDRLVKQAFAGLDLRGVAERLTRRPITAGDDEVASNPRARSAKLRAVRLLEGRQELPLGAARQR